MAERDGRGSVIGTGPGTSRCPPAGGSLADPMGRPGATESLRDILNSIDFADAPARPGIRIPMFVITKDRKLDFAEVDAEIERLLRLAADLYEFRQGDGPTDAELRGAPII